MTSAWMTVSEQSGTSASVVVDLEAAIGEDNALMDVRGTP